MGLTGLRLAPAARSTMPELGLGRMGRPAAPGVVVLPGPAWKPQAPPAGHYTALLCLILKLLRLSCCA